MTCPNIMEGFMLKRAKILLVEDEMDLLNLMNLHLTREGYEVVTASSAEEAIPHLQKETFDCAVLDWMLPGASGLKLCELYAGKFPILLLTARAEPTDIVLGLSTGADDYVTKPFEVSVFLARVASLLRRKTWTQGNKENTILKMGKTELNIDSHKCNKGKKEIHLTPMEFKLLGVLLKNKDRVLTREKLVDYLQDSASNVVDRTVDQHIFSLRKKLGDDANAIETIRGVGYRVSSQHD
jgi:two-component system phosphate regulon response regulator PhoB